MKHTVKVTFENGDTINTEINGTIESIKEYYKIGKRFNLGSAHDNMQVVSKLEFVQYCICFDTICEGFQAVTDENNNPVLYSTEKQAQNEIDSDIEFNKNCFICLLSELGHKTIYSGKSI